MKRNIPVAFNLGEAVNIRGVHGIFLLTVTSGFFSFCYSFVHSSDMSVLAQLNARHRMQNVKGPALKGLSPYFNNKNWMKHESKLQLSLGNWAGSICWHHEDRTKVLSLGLFLIHHIHNMNSKYKMLVVQEFLKEK